jgi:protein-S-isoprenylcysteine O-methyltransferase Ste14
MAKRLMRWMLVSTAMIGGVMLLAGRFDDPWLWAYAAAWLTTSLYAMASIDEELARERFSPPESGADRWWLLAVQIVALAHLIVGGLDNRLHWSPRIPPSVRGAALAGMAAAFFLVFRAMRENQFFSSVVRIQTERGHRVVTTGPYAIVRHPGYVGMIVGVPLSGRALGSYASAAVALIYSALIVRRVTFEDCFLRQSLPGYAEYAARVRHRLVPGVW